MPPKTQETIAQPEPTTVALSRDLATQHVSELAALANQIPGVDYTEEAILAEQKGDRQMLNKWGHSLVVLSGNKAVAFIMGYERQAEGNQQYPDNTIYLSELAVEEAYRGKGIAKDLLKAFFIRNNQIGFQSLEGELNYSIQTNSADWNKHVIDLYKSFGFSERARKTYPNRTDVVLGVAASALMLP